MSVYAIVLLEENREVENRIRTHFPDHYKYSPSFFLVEADILTEEVAITVGIKGENRVENASGFVLKLEEFTYAGYTTRSLWEWFKEAAKRTP